MEDAPLDSVARAIVAYLKANPHAADSAEGVARWWVGAGEAGASVERVERALTLLAARQALRCVTLADGTKLYSQAQMDRKQTQRSEPWQN